MIRPTFFAALLFTSGTSLFGQAFPNWNGSTANWSNNANWTGGTASSYGQLEFKGAGVTTTNNDVSGLSQWRLYFQNGAAYTLNGNAVNLFDFGGAHSWVLNDASANQTINLGVNFAATAGDTFGQVSARGTGNLTMGDIGITGTQVAQVRFAGESTGTITVGGVISGSGKQVVIGLNQAAVDQGNTVVNFNGANTYTGDTFIVAGKLVVGSTGSIATASTLQLGQTTGTAAATLEFNAASGGQTIANNLTVRAGSSGTKTLSILNTSGTQTFTGGITLNDNLALSASAGSQSFNTSSFNVTNKTLTVNTSGTTTFGNALTSSLGTGGVLIKDGAGTLVLSSTSNTYTGTTNTALAANGTRINAGTLAIAGDGSLGLAPSTAVSNVQFTGNGTLRFDSATTLAATRNIAVGSGITATFNNNGNAVTIGGVISGTTGATTFTGSGTTVLTGTNTYGITGITSGATLQIGNGGTTGTLGTGDVQNDGTLAFNRSNNMTVGNMIFGDGALVQAGSGTTTLTGNFNNYTGGTTITGGTLEVNNTSGSGTGTGDVIVDAGGTLAGTGSITIDSGNIVYVAGNFVIGSTTGAPTAADFSLSTSLGTVLNVDTTGVLKFDLFTGAGLGNNNATPTAADILAIQGSAIFATGSLLEIANPNGMTAWAAGDSWRIWDTTNTGTLTGTLALSAPTLTGGLNWDFNQSTGILSIVGVPEPSRAILLLGGILGFTLRRRRE